MPRTDPDKVKLLLGPYRCPRLHRGDRAQCLYRDKDVIVTGLSAGRIPWPLCLPTGGRGQPGLLVEEELARAVRCESVLALRHWWGASPRVVWCWRQALGVARHNEGSLRLYRLHGRAVGDSLRGKPLPPEAVERRRRTAIELNLGQYLQPCPNGSRPWTDDELTLLGTMTDHALALQLWRSVNAVRSDRVRHGIAPHPDQQAWRDVPSAGQPWTHEDDDLVLRLSPGEAADRLGRSVQAVYDRRKEVRGRRGACRRRSCATPGTRSRDHAIGTLPAPEAARQLGRPLWVVYNRRQDLGVADGQRVRPILPKAG
jgi:hypothetical protein